MANHDTAGREAMTRPSSIKNMPMTSMGDILPMVLSSLGTHRDTAGCETTSNFLRTLYNMNRNNTVSIYDITADRYKRNLQVVFASDMIINTCRTIHERPLGACINLFLAEDVKETASVLKKVTYVAPRVPKPKRLATRAAHPYKHTMERLFDAYSFDSDVDIPMAIYDQLVKDMKSMQMHAEDDMPVEKKYVYLKRMKQELTQDVNRLLVNSQIQMRMGVVNVHLCHMVANSASVDMLSALDDIGTEGEECCLSTALDIVVQKQLEQWLVPQENHMAAIRDTIEVFDTHTSTPTEEGGLTITVGEEDKELPLGGIVMMSGIQSLRLPTSQQQATYKRKVRSLELKNEDYNTDRLMVQPNMAQQAFPQYTMDSRVVVKEHDRHDVIAKEKEKGLATTTDIQGIVTMLPLSLPSGVVLLDNVSSVYIVDKDREMDPLVSMLTHATQSMWNMMSGHSTMENANKDFMKSDKMSHVYMDTGTPDLYLNPSGRRLQKISSCMIKDAVFNDPYIYSPLFAQCFNTMYTAAMKLPKTSPTHLLFAKCMRTASMIFKDAHAWHGQYRSNQRDFTLAGNGDMIMSELHPYFDALPTGAGLKAYNRLVQGNIPLYIRPTASMLLAGQTLAEKIWGHMLCKEHMSDIDTAKVLAKEINAFFTGIVPTADRSVTHMLYSVPCTSPSSGMVDSTILIQGLCGLPLLSPGVVTRGDNYTWEDSGSGLTVQLDVPDVNLKNHKEGEVADTCFFHKLTGANRGGEGTFSYMVRPAFHELMKEIKSSTDCFAVKMCAMFCAWIRLTAEGTEFAFNHTHWPLAATVLTFKKDATKHVLVSRPNSIISLADVPTTEIKPLDDKITIASTAHHRVACDGINPNSVIALHAFGSARTNTFCMTVSTPPAQMKDTKVADTTTPVFIGYKKLVDSYHIANSRKRTNTGQQIISLSGEQLAWVCPPVVPSSAFQRPTNPTGRSSLPRTSDTSVVDASVEMHDPTRENGTGVSTLNPYATLPGGYVFCLHADPNGKVGEVSNSTYRTSRGASRAAHFFSPLQLMTVSRDKASASLAKKMCRLPCSRRVMGDQQKFPNVIDGDSCNSSMSCWSEATGLAQHEPHASNALIYASMISNRQADSTYASREVDWFNHHYAVLGHTFYAKDKSYASRVVSPP
jgi:hypothetical protein